MEQSIVASLSLSWKRFRETKKKGNSIIKQKREEKRRDKLSQRCLKWASINFFEKWRKFE